MIRSMTRSTLENKVNYRSLLAGNTAFSPGSYDLLETTILTSSASSVSFTGLGSYSDYKHLQIRGAVKTDRANESDEINLTFNSITNSYAFHRLFGDGASVSSGEDSPNKVAARILGLAGNSTANNFGGMVCDVLDFSSSTKNTTIRALAGNAESNITLSSGLVANTAAITSINLDVYLGSNFLTGSRFSLYGLKETV